MHRITPRPLRDVLPSRPLSLRPPGLPPPPLLPPQVGFYLLKRLLGVKTADGSRGAKVAKLAKGEILMVNIGSTSTGGKVSPGTGWLIDRCASLAACWRRGCCARLQLPWQAHSTPSCLRRPR